MTFACEADALPLSYETGNERKTSARRWHRLESRCSRGRPASSVWPSDALETSPLIDMPAAAVPGGDGKRR